MASIPTHTVTKDQLPLPRRSSRSSDLRSFFGLANQLAASTDQIAKLLEPMCPLLSPKNEFLHTTQYYSNLVALNTLGLGDIEIIHYDYCSKRHCDYCKYCIRTFCCSKQSRASSNKCIMSKYYNN